jgi:hypothetical protein
VLQHRADPVAGGHRVVGGGHLRLLPPLLHLVLSFPGGQATAAGWGQQKAFIAPSNPARGGQSATDGSRSAAVCRELHLSGPSTPGKS